MQPNKEQPCLDEDELPEGYTYVLLFGRDTYETNCPKTQDDGIECLIVPEFLIPNRPYPIYVYLYGILLYSLNPEMGQRKAAEKTRKRFDLKTFSHTTLGRAIKKLEVRIKAFENKPEGEESLQECRSCFPSVEHTHKRRETVISFLSGAIGQNNQEMKDTLQPQESDNYRKPPYEGAFFNMCQRIVQYVFIKYSSLLL